MPSEPKPKTFVAAVAFRHGNKRYAAGEVVADRRVIDRLVRYGDRFITVKRTKTPAVDTATTDQSTKEDEMVASAKLFVEPNVVIGTTEVQCHLQKVTMLAEVFKRVNVETYCNPGGEVPVVRWTGTITVRQSFGSDSAWAFFSDLAYDVPLDFVIYPGDPGTGTGTADNPSATFDAYLDPIGFIPDHEVGGSGTFDLTFTVVGLPIFDDT